MLGYPGDSTEDKMQRSIFTLMPADSFGTPRNTQVCRTHPDIVKESVQIFLCSWDDRYPLQHNKECMEYHFLLRIDKIIMQKKWEECLFKGQGFPPLPIDFGYRDNVRFWFTKHSPPYAVPIPREKGNTMGTVRYACSRFDPTIKWQDEACAKLLQVPAIFLNGMIEMVVDAAKEEGITFITPQFVDKLRDKRTNKK